MVNEKKVVSGGEKIRVCIYCYQNHPENMEKDKISHSQKEILLDYTKNQSTYAVAMIIEDFGSRTGFERVMQACRAGEIDIILIKNLNRLGRDFIKVLGILKELQLLDVQVVDITGTIMKYEEICVYTLLATIGTGNQDNEVDFRKKAIYIRAPFDADEQTVDEQIQKVVTFVENMGYQVEGISLDGFYDDEM